MDKLPAAIRIQNPRLLGLIAFNNLILFALIPLMVGMLEPWLFEGIESSFSDAPLRLVWLVATGGISFTIITLPFLFLQKHPRLATIYTFSLLPLASIGLAAQTIMFREFGTEINLRVLAVFDGNFSSVWQYACHHYHIDWAIIAIFILSIGFTKLLFTLSRNTSTLFPSVKFYFWAFPIFLLCSLLSVALGTNIKEIPGYHPEKLSRAPLFQFITLGYDFINENDTGYRTILEKAAPVALSNRQEISIRLGQSPELFVAQRTSTPEWLKRKPDHVFLFILESFGLNLITDPKLRPLAPSLNRFAKEGLYTTNFCATGHYTMHAIHSALPGVAHTNQTPSPETIRIFKLDTLPKIMKRAGYRPLFFCASHGEIASKGDFCKAYGYDDFLSCPDLKPSLPSNDWGVNDADFFRWCEGRLGDLESPHFITFLNVSNHAPYDAPVPNVFFGKSTLSCVVGRTSEEKLRFARHIYFADAQVNNMMSFLQRKYPHALFLFMGDHENSKVMNSGSGTVPFILWNSNVIDNSPSTASWRGSQMDVVASLADIVLPNHTEIKSLGRPIWSNDPIRISLTHKYIIAHDGVRDLKGRLIKSFPSTPSIGTIPPLDYAKKASAIKALTWGYLNSEYLPGEN